MHIRYLLLLLLAELLFWAESARAEPLHPLINEVMWAGSDLSSSDEWFELFLPPCADGSSCDPVSLASYTITYLKSTGQETVMVTFPAGFTIQPGQFLLISNLHADFSRLVLEPALVSSSVTLANSGLRLRLKDPSGMIVDEVDDGVGVPFAGANPSAPIPKASMERIDPSIAGTIKENWRTASTSRGLDAGANMLATPGFENGSVDPIPFSSSSSSSSSSTSSSQSSSSLISSSSSSSSSSQSSSSFVSSASFDSFVSSSCTSDLLPAISLQSGDFTGTSKVTLNVQAVASIGTLDGATCHFDFGDGYTSDSCNPPVHSYATSGIFSLNLEVKNQCDTTLIQSQTVQVFPGSVSSSSVSNISGSPQVFNDDRIVISGILPNPDAKDTDKEWIELKNLEDRTVPLAGWHLAIGSKTIHRYTIDTTPTILPHDTVRLYQIETGISLSNARDKVDLVNPQGLVVSAVIWDKAEEGRVYRQESFKDRRILGTVTRVIDPEHFSLTLDGPSSFLVGLDQVGVTLIGMKGFDADTNLSLSSYEVQALEFVRALIENKKVELFFDADVWERDGHLLAYVMIDDGRILQRELLSSGLALADSSSSYVSRQEYIDTEKKAIERKSGIWSVLSIPSVSTIYGAQADATKIASIDTFPETIVPAPIPTILITEVFAAPSSKMQDDASGSLLSQEWIEMRNPLDQIFSLKGWMLTLGKKTITFGATSVLQPNQHVVLLTHQVGLKLKNDGDTITFTSPDKSTSASVEYPKMKVGYSYTLDESTESYCISKTPSAGAAGSCAIVAKVSAAKTTVSAVKKATKKRKNTTYDRYAAQYLQGLSQGSEQDSIVLESPESDSTRTVPLVTMGMLMGSMTSLLAFRLPRVRGFFVPE